MRLTILLAALLLPASASFAGQLKPFTTDGCSMWVDGTPTNPNLWRHCCVAHDRDYWLGGTEAQRKTADELLRSCVVATGEKAMASYLYMNVRWGGAPFWMTAYRWGYGWDYLEDGKPRGYRTPSAQELLQINALLPGAEELLRQDLLTHNPEQKKLPPSTLSISPAAVKN